MFILLLQLNCILHCKLKINHPLFIFFLWQCIFMLGWVRNCLQNVHSDWVFDFLFQGAFFYMNFLFVFPVSK